MQAQANGTAREAERESAGLALGRPGPRSRARYEAFWAGAELDRPLLFVTAPLPAGAPHPDERRPATPDDCRDWFLNPARVLPRLARAAERLYYAGDAFPVIFPVAPSLPAMQAAFMGGDYRIAPENGSGWCDPVIGDLEQWIEAWTLDAANPWWTATQTLLREAHGVAQGRLVVGHPDTQGGGQVLDLLRGTERLALDLIEQPRAVKRAMRLIDEAWRQYWTTMNGIIGRYQHGHADWLQVYSERPMVCPECDLSCMISTDMFVACFVPSIVFQCETAGRSLYHLDGPGALRHLDVLLSLPCLDGIQWVPGAGAQPMRAWLPVLQRIQHAGKRVHFACAADEAEPLLAALRPRGVYLRTACATPAEADALVARIARHFGAAD